MNDRLINFVVFVLVAGFCWYILKLLLTALTIPSPWDTIAIAVFAFLVVLSALDYLRGGTWWFKR